MNAIQVQDLRKTFKVQKTARASKGPSLICLNGNIPK